MRIHFKNSNLFSIATISLCIFVTGCNTTTQNTDNKQIPNKSANAFSVYSSFVNSIKLPLKGTCDDTLPAQRLKLPDSLRLFEKQGQLIGKIQETGKYTALLYAIPADIQLPVLEIFNKDGKEISSLKLFIGNCCGENEDCSGLSTFQITKDLHIILKDSTQTFERDKKHSDKKRNIKTDIKIEVFKIDSTGTINRENSLP